MKTSANFGECIHVFGHGKPVFLRMLPTIMNPIRRAHDDDLDTLVALERACLPDAWRKKTLQSLLLEARYLVLLVEDWGYIIGWSASGTAEIERIGVLPQQRGQGIGAALVHEMVAAFANRGAREIWLEVRESNVAARALYAACEFDESGRRREYYDDGEDAILMKRELMGNKEQVTSGNATV